MSTHPIALEGKRILLGVSGGIAAYKSPDLVRRLSERGAQVQVVTTPGAEQFITPLSLQAVSGREVRRGLWDESAEAAMGHIELARWADLVLIAPASADLIARLTAGLADDLLATLCLATEAPLMLAPAMNRVMWANAATQDNVSALRARDVTLLGPGQGAQACGETGLGRMLAPEEIADEVEAFFTSSNLLAGVRVLITAGPTREAIDPVRFLSNRSSGKMGYAVAQAAAEAGAEVTLVSGPVNLAVPRRVQRVNVQSAQQMHDAVHEQVADCEVFIATAAVADFQCAAPSEHKVKKTEMGDDWSIALKPAPDVLASVGALAKPPFTVGFAAETQALEKHARGKLKRKKLNMIAANLVGDGRAFETDHNALEVFWHDGARELPSTSKLQLARQLVGLIAERYNTDKSRGGRA